MRQTAVILGMIIMAVSVVLFVFNLFMEVFSWQYIVALLVGFVLVFWGTSDVDKIFPDDADKGQMW